VIRPAFPTKAFAVIAYGAGADPGGAIAPLKPTKVAYSPQFFTIRKTTFAI